MACSAIAVKIVAFLLRSFFTLIVDIGVQPQEQLVGVGGRRGLHAHSFDVEVQQQVPFVQKLEFRKLFVEIAHQVLLRNENDPFLVRGHLGDISSL